MVILVPSANAVSEKLIEDTRAADAAQDRGDHKEAIRLYSLVLASSELPGEDRPAIHFNRGVSHLRSKEADRAIADFDEAIRLRTDFAEAYAYRGATYLNKNQAQKAINDLDRAIRLKPNYPDSHYYRGVAYLGKEQPERAIPEFDEAIRLNSKYAEAYHKRGLARAMMGKPKEAIPDYDAAIERNPAYAHVYSDRGVAYFYTGSPERAIVDFDTALRLGMNDTMSSAETYYRRGLVLYDQKRNDQGLSDFEATIRLQPDRVDAYVLRGIIFNRANQFDRAIDSLTKAIHLKPDYMTAYLNRGFAHRFKGEVQAAIADFDTVLRLQPTLAEAYLYRGFGYAQKGDYDQAHKDFGEALRLKPDDDLSRRVFRTRAAVYFAEGRFGEAAKSYEQALKISAQDDYVVLWLHLTRARMGLVDTEELAHNAKQLDSKEWPGPLIMLYMGKATAEEVRASAKVDNAEEQRRRQCEVTFHAGEYEFLRKNVNTAKQLLKQAASTCPPGSPEKIVAPEELRRIASVARME